MRVVLDTNVYLSALITPEGPSGSILHAWRDQRRFVPILSATLDELEEVLARPKFAPLLRRSPQWIAGFRQELRNAAAFVEPAPVDAIPRDPPDNLILGAAVAGAADYLVSGNAHLLDLGRFRGIPIVTPRQFLDLLEREEDASCNEP
jgi:uncharacterized protein